jgi:MFS family permease
MSRKSFGKTFQAVYLLGFIFALHTALPAYISSEFLSSFTGNKLVGVIFAISSIATIFAFSKIGKFLQTYGDYKVTLSLVIATLLSMLGIYFSQNPILVALFFIIITINSTLIAFNIDVFLEKVSDEGTTGTIRGNFLSIANSAWILAPLLAGFIVSGENYRDVFLISGLLLLPMISILSSNFSHFKDSEYKHIPFKKLIQALPKHKSTYKILASNFILGFFFSWMVIYTPIYLHNFMNFDWKEIGLMFTIMLFPFTVLEAPLGRLADERWGEKEMLTAGFIITAIATATLFFIPNADFWLWSAGLLVTRIGASTIEIMNETYFFKKASEDQLDVIGLFRMTKPVASVIAPILGTIFLMFFDYKYMFLALGAIVLCGLKYSLTLKDTK